MQKVLDILEQHVQWIAIGLGALFVLFMVWAYVLTPPAQVTIGDETYGPGEVDAYTADTVAQELNAAINSTGKITMTVPKYAAVFQENMAWKDAKPIELAGIWNSQIKDVEIPVAPQPIDPNVPQPRPGDPPQVAGEKIKALPELPKAETAETKQGRSVVIMPVAGQPAPQPVVVPGQPVQGGEDKDWVTQLFKIDMPQMAAAFKKVGITTPPLPQELAKTVFLQVEMERQELQPDGSWGETTIVPKLEVWRQNQPPPPFPAENADRGVQATYLAWATANTPDILQPAFYATIPQMGDQWTKPGAAAVVEQAFNPLQWIDTPDLTPLTKDQREQVMQLRRDRAAQQQEERRRNRPTGPRPGRTPPGGIPDVEGDMMYAPARGGAQRNFAPAPRPPARQPYPPRQPYGGAPYGGVPPYGGGGYMEGDMMEGEFMPGGYGGGVVEQGLPQPGTDYPQGEFIPGDPQAPWAAKKIEVWCHDATVEPGKTYRYRIRYKIKNPIFAAGGVAADPKLSEQFAIVSPESEWSGSVRVPELVNFFVASSKAPNANTVRFDVFTWDQGQTRKETFVVGPGDVVGGERDGVDYGTDWTVVDFREDPRQGNDYQIMLVNNADGSIAVRSYRADSTDPLYKALKEQIKAAEALTAPPTAGVGGAVPPGPVGMRR